MLDFSIRLIPGPLPVENIPKTSPEWELATFAFQMNFDF